jgi:hypothetical protein
MTTALDDEGGPIVDAPVYANMIHVSHTPFDFRLTFSLLGTPHEDSADGGSVIPRPVVALNPTTVAELALPPATIAAFIDLLQEQLNGYTAEFGSPALR